MSAGTVTTLRLTDADRHDLLRILLLARRDGNPHAERLIGLVDKAYAMACDADRILFAAIDDAEALDGAA